MAHKSGPYAGSDWKNGESVADSKFRSLSGKWATFDGNPVRWTGERRSRRAPVPNRKSEKSRNTAIAGWKKNRPGTENRSGASLLHGGTPTSSCSWLWSLRPQPWSPGTRWPVGRRTATWRRFSPSHEGCLRWSSWSLPGAWFPWRWEECSLNGISIDVTPRGSPRDVLRDALRDALRDGPRGAPGSANAGNPGIEHEWLPRNRATSSASRLRQTVTIIRPVTVPEHLKDWSDLNSGSGG